MSAWPEPLLELMTIQQRSLNPWIHPPASLMTWRSALHWSAITTATMAVIWTAIIVAMRTTVARAASARWRLVHNRRRAAHPHGPA